MLKMKRTELLFYLLLISTMWAACRHDYNFIPMAQAIKAGKFYDSFTANETLINECDALFSSFSGCGSWSKSLFFLFSWTLGYPIQNSYVILVRKCISMGLNSSFSIAVKSNKSSVFYTLRSTRGHILANLVSLTSMESLFCSSLCKESLIKLLWSRVSMKRFINHHLDRIQMEIIVHHQGPNPTGDHHPPSGHEQKNELAVLDHNFRIGG